MDISAGDSTPTSEASYAHSGTPTTTTGSSGAKLPPDAANSTGTSGSGSLLLATALPRLASHPSTPTSSQLHFANTAISSSSTASSALGTNNTSSVVTNSSGVSSSVTLPNSKLATKSSDLHHPHLPTSSPSTGATSLVSNSIQAGLSSSINHHHLHHQQNHHSNEMLKHSKISH